MHERMTVEAALAAVRDSDDGLYGILHTHGTLEIGFYRPDREDHQEPHDRDEVYVVHSGSGTFLCGDRRRPFEAGETLFVPAGVVHRFEDFSDDFCAWVFFYGPVGGEAGS